MDNCCPFREWLYDTNKNDLTKWEALLCNKLNQIGKHDFMSLKIPTNCKWNFHFLEELLDNYDDKRIVDFLRYGFPISQVNDTGCSDIPQN